MKKVLAAFILLIAFNEGYSQVWGEENSRTESRNDAGLQGSAGAKSGFFQAWAPVNFPAGATDWWHLLDVRHSNSNSNFAMQFAGNFYDQNLYFRKTVGNPAQPWSRILAEAPDGDVGIGTVDPMYPLHIKASPGYLLNLECGGTFSGLRMQASACSKALGIHFTADGFQNNSLRFGRYGSTGNSWESNPVIFGLNAPNGSVVLTDFGYLGLGTFYPSEKLSVNGNIRAKKVIVSRENWADYVFEPTYKLPSLDSIASFIKENKHLPEMPSAATIEKDGQDVGEIQKLLLKKVEELTLYMIETKKENELLKEKVEALSKEIERRKKNQ